MKIAIAIAIAIAALPAVVPAAPPAAAGQKPACERWTIPARYYRSFGERLAIYVGDIRSGPAFTLRVLVGSYRRPFLSSTGVLSESGVDTLLKSRRDIVQHRLDWKPGAKGVVNVTVDNKPVTVRVIQPTASDVAGEVCGLR